MKSKRKLYYQLYDCFSLILRTYNPCKFNKDKCIANHRNGCCNKCTLNTFAGCSIQSLGCKSFLCETAFYSLPKRIQNRWRILTEIKENYFPYLKNKETYMIQDGK